MSITFLSLPSIQVTLVATFVALILGSLAAFAVSRTKFFGREAISFLIVLPIALPGIITDIALRSAIGLLGLDFFGRLSSATRPFVSSSCTTTSSPVCGVRPNP